jgi:RNA polymerase sigma-70 factor, ECF subfamily
MEDQRGQFLDRPDTQDLSIGNEELLARCARGDQESLRMLFSRHERPVYGLLYRMLGNHEDAEEALADVFVKVWRSADKFRGEAAFTTWLYHIAANTARDRLRSRKYRAEIPLDALAGNEAEFVRQSPGEATPEEAAIRGAENALLAAAMMRLSDEDRLLIDLYHLQDHTYEEIAEITKLSPAHLKVKMFRARQRLKTHYQAVTDEEGENGLRNRKAESTGLVPPTAGSL